MSIHGGDIYRNPGVLDFSANCNCFGMPASVREAAMRGVQCADAYPDPECEALREAIAAYERVKADHILCGNGASELLLAIATALQPKRALLAAPGFLEYERVLTALGAEIQWSLLSDKEEYLPGETFLDALQKTDADMVILSNPNNPTGALMLPEYIRQIVTITEERKIMLVMDECFLDFLEDADRYSAKQYLSADSSLIVLKAFTKTFACAGLRIGYLLCSDQDVLCKCKIHLPEWNVSLPATYAGIAASKERPWLAETSSQIRAEREWLLEQWEREKKTVLFITHDVEEAVFLSSRILVVENMPITHLKSIEVPAEYPRTREELMRPEIVKLKEDLIDMLRRETV